MVGPSTYFRPEHLGALQPEVRRLIEQRERVLGASYRLFYQEPFVAVSGAGATLTDHTGRTYLDFYNNVAVVGHARPEVVAAMAQQAALVNSHTRYLHPSVAEYSELLLSSLPDPLDRVVYTCTGSEANDLALRIARAVTGHQGVIVTDYAYHGITEATAELSPSLLGPEHLGSRVRVVSSPMNPSGNWATEVDAAISDLKKKGLGVAAFLLDTVLASDGLWPHGSHPTLDADIEYVTRAVREAGGLVIADEVQGGFARVGQSFWGFVDRGMTPDLVTLGKPMGNGYPVAGVVAPADTFQLFSERGRYFNTFGGTPVAMAAARATWEVLHKEDIPAHVERLGEVVGRGLREMLLQPCVSAVRGVGLYWSVDLVNESGEPDQQHTTAVVNRMREKGILLAASGPHNSSLKIRPPLVVNDEQVAQFLGALQASLQEDDQ